jgi:nucleoside-diphosphate-sugar epimerase
MRVLLTGHDGYIGTILVPLLRADGHQVVGVDSFLFGDRQCALGPEWATPQEILRRDIRDLDRGDLEGVDAVIHLAAISNDPLGDLTPDTTYDINHRATTRLARLAKAAGVERFVFSSSCSLYGSQGDGYIDETADFNPVTPYGESKILAEQDLLNLADDGFSPVFLRNATAYGVSPRVRGDLVVNNLTGFAVATGKVFLKSDGSSWRPLVHIEDIARAMVAVLGVDRSVIHRQAFNVGATEENYRIRDVAAIVGEVVPDSRVTLSDEAFNDPRNYRVNCDRFAATFPEAVPRWTVRKGVEELYAAFSEHDLTLDDLEGDRFMRVRHVRRLLDERRIDDGFRWTAEVGS